MEITNEVEVNNDNMTSLSNHQQQNFSITPRGDYYGFSPEKVEIIKNAIAKGCSDEELHFFLAVCQSTGLNPFNRQIYAIRRKQWDAVSETSKYVITIQVSIDGLRSIAQNTGNYRGQIGPFWCGKDGKWQDVWLEDTPPAAAKIAVLHSDFKKPLWRAALWKEYAQTDKNGKVTNMWAKFPTLMLAKVAEALALRSAFPRELGGLYTTDEMSQATDSPNVHSSAQPVYDQERSYLMDSIAKTMRNKHIDTDTARNLMRKHFGGSATKRDDLTTPQLKQFLTLLEQCQEQEEDEAVLAVAEIV